jgi:hypothetical protein
MAESSGSVRVNPSPADCLAFKRFYGRHTRWQWPVLVLAGIAAFFLANFLAGKLADIGFAPKDEAILLSFGAVSVVFLAIWQRFVGKKAGGDLTLIPYAIAASEDGIRYSREGVKTDIEWRAIHDVQEGREHIFVMLSSRAAYPIPRRSFSSDAEYRDFFQRVKKLHSEHTQGNA